MEPPRASPLSQDNSVKNFSFSGPRVAHLGQGSKLGFEAKLP